MSKNFELMQQAEIRLDMPGTAEPSFDPSSNGIRKNGHAKGARFDWDDQVTRDESFKLVQNIFLLGGQEHPRVVTFAGVDSNSGCSEICVHTAQGLARQKVGRVCLVDGNLRSPKLPGIFGVSNHYGLTDALSKPGAIRDFTNVVGPENLSLLSCGSLPVESRGLLNSENMKMRISELRKEFDYVLIDAPPLTMFGDSLSVAQLSDGLVIVLEANATRRGTAAKVTDDLRAAQINILGAVLNKRTFPIPSSLYRRL